MFLTYAFPAFVGLILLGIGYKVFIDPKRWMKRYGDGVYNPLMKAYKNASEHSKAQSEGIRKSLGFSWKV